MPTPRERWCFSYMQVREEFLTVDLTISCELGSYVQIQKENARGWSQAVVVKAKGMLLPPPRATQDRDKGAQDSQASLYTSIVARNPPVFHSRIYKSTWGGFHLLAYHWHITGLRSIERKVWVVMTKPSSAFHILGVRVGKWLKIELDVTYKETEPSPYMIRLAPSLSPFYNWGNGGLETVNYMWIKMVPEVRLVPEQHVMQPWSQEHNFWEIFNSQGNKGHREGYRVEDNFFSHKHATICNTNTTKVSQGYSKL
jgi:hypothetical protein